MTTRVKPTFRDLEQRAIADHAMRVYLDPKAPDDVREDARKRLLSTSEDFDWDRLTLTERREMLRLMCKARGEDENGDPWPTDLANQRGRAASLYHEAENELYRARERLRAVWPDYAAVRPPEPPRPAPAFVPVGCAAPEPAEPEVEYETPEPDPEPDPEPADLIELDDQPSDPRARTVRWSGLTIPRGKP